MDTHFHFIIWAAKDKDKENYSGVTYIDIIENDMDAAIAKAKNICPGRKHYWVNNIVEHHHDHSSED